MMRIILFSLLITLFITSCTANNTRKELLHYPKYKNIEEWRIGVNAASFYPIKIISVFAINQTEDWTSLFPNSFQLYRVLKLENIRSSMSTYDGYGISLRRTAAIRNQLIPYRTLPEIVHIKWVALIEEKVYSIAYQVPQRVKDIMENKVKLDIELSQCGEYSPKDIVFAMLPTQKVKVFLYGCGKPIYVDTINADYLPDYSPLVAEGYIEDAKAYNQKHGVTAFPVDEDKVNREFY